jgi:hypothetical protein
VVQDFVDEVMRLRQPVVMHARHVVVRRLLLLISIGVLMLQRERLFRVGGHEA